MQIAFKAFDINGDGVISTTELFKVMKELGVGQTEDEIKLLIDGVDKDHNGTLNFEEFTRLMEIANDI